MTTPRDAVLHRYKRFIAENNDTLSPSCMFPIIEQLVDSFGDTELSYLYNFLEVASINANANPPFTNISNEMAQNIGEIYAAIVEKINLIEKIHQLVANGTLRITRMHTTMTMADRYDMSSKIFTSTEYLDLTILSIVSKLAAPITYILTDPKRCVGFFDIALHKEMFAFPVFSKIRQHWRLRATDFRLADYVYNRVKYNIDQNPAIIRISTITDLQKHIHATLFVKKFVQIDLFFEYGDIVKYINDSIGVFIQRG